MVKLNLSNLEDSELKYKISQFPDGQQDVQILPNGRKLSGITVTGNKWSLGVTIYSRMNSVRDIELITCANQALKRLGVAEIHLNVPYILGARSDRKFDEGGTSYLVDVIAPMINTQGFQSVTALDAHSDTCAAAIHNFVSQDNLSIVEWALEEIGYNPVLVTPDAGASKKIYPLIDKLQLTRSELLKLVIAMKHRDLKTGRIVSTTVTLPYEAEGNMVAKTNYYAIIDDICDGGRTFIELAKALKEQDYSCKVFLIVTHGIFSGGLEELEKHLDGIYTTNSIQDLSKEALGDFVHQMKVL